MSPALALAIFGPIGTTELVIILVILVLIFGATKLPQLGGALGKTIKSFKKEMKEEAKGDEEKPADKAAGFCPHCGAEVSDPEAKFCPKCGKGLQVFS